MRGVTHPIETGAPRKWLTLLAMTGSLCMILLDVTVVGVSLPAIQADLHLSDVQTQWVVNAYILAMASTVALGGRTADALGKVPSFVIGVLAFTGASVGCAISTGVVGIVGWRAVQGVAGALMQPASASLVVGSFAPGERGKAGGSGASPVPGTGGTGPPTDRPAGLGAGARPTGRRAGTSPPRSAPAPTASASAATGRTARHPAARSSQPPAANRATSRCRR
jgi:MFS family permease